ncbi:biotin synthase BioB [Candidatus Nitronereus thalassa]|uniref:Biotin synthase n=1 Tax=Candidatus Nitronereus thalassa TaxID=3020898 RepID=A0ABU3KAN8_9BACT|nr:biotin synthase BioB [Candidatus Nitronereus thalassa]MDT7043485.1 biotin synthase BioB [Candidatus Nitronereus thalassa]
MTDYMLLADKVLHDEEITREEGLALLHTPDEELLGLINAAYRIRHRHFGNTVTLQMLFNAKSGACIEDCHYCSQSSISKAPIERYALVEPEQMLTAARRAAESKAQRYCVVISGRSPLDREIDVVSKAVRQIKEELPIQVCCSLGLLTEPQAKSLKAAGVDRINHNLNTSEAYHASICTTHTFQDRLTTLNNARAAGLELCSGGIVGMGEQDEDLVDLALSLKELNPDSIPLNMLHPQAGTPLEDCNHLTPQRCLKIMSMFRFIHPKRELRAAGGREFNLRSLQPLALYVADSLFVNGYLTTPGDPAHEVQKMIEDMGFEVAVNSSACSA